jgi:hypothetical protein
MFVLPRQNCIHCSTSSWVICPLGHIRYEKYSFHSRSDTWSRKTNLGLDRMHCMGWRRIHHRVTGNKVIMQSSKWKSYNISPSLYFKITWHTRLILNMYVCMCARGCVYVRTRMCVCAHADVCMCVCLNTQC